MGLTVSLDGSIDLTDMWATLSIRLGRPIFSANASKSAKSLKPSTLCVLLASVFFLLGVERIYTDRDMSSSPRADGERPHSKLEEALEIKSLRRIISAYLKLDDPFHSINNLLSHLLLISFIDVLFSMHLGVSLTSPVDELTFYGFCDFRTY